MAGLLGIFKHSPRSKAEDDSLRPISSSASYSSGLAPVSSHRSSRSLKHEEPKPVTLKYQIESAPLIMYGPPATSSGALMSGVLDLDVRKASTLSVATLRLIQKVTYKSVKGAPTNLEIIAQWDILQTSQLFDVGVHEYPFSHLLPGMLPPSSNQKYFSIEYYLDANVVVDGCAKPISEKMTLNIGRSVESIQEKSSMRLFPPTEMSLSMTLPDHVFPKGSFVAELRIENLNGAPQETNQMRWTVRKMTWKMLETTKMVLPAGNEFQAEDEVYTGILKNGWKIDHSENGVVELLTRELSKHTLDLHKDINDTVLKISVTHKLSLEVMIAEEAVASKTATVGIATGRARALRVQFNISIVDPPGLGISWDDEVPPVYADVPLSPPNYDTPGMAALEEIPSMMFSPLQPSFSPTLRDLHPELGDGSGTGNGVPPPSQLEIPGLGESFIQQIRRKHGSSLRPSHSAPPAQ